MVFGIGLAACSSVATEAPASEEAAEATQVPEVEESSQEDEPEDLEQPAPVAEGETIFALDPAASEARFSIGELLANAPNTVVAVNSQVQGGGVLNFLDPAQSRLDDFTIDASGFVTDSGLRDRAIRQFILQSDQYPEIQFQVTSISGFPDAITIGESVSFEITGTLTIRDISQETTFVGEATVVSEGRVEGMATATVLRADYELTIPSVPRVADVDEEVILEIEFVAIAQ